VLLAASYALQRLGSTSHLDRLVAALATPAVRELAEMYLIDLSASAAPALAGFLKDSSPSKRAIVAEILGFSNDPSVVPSLEALVRDSDAGAAQAAGRALARIRLAPAIR
jgi:HEAT repeat protein